MEKIPLVSKGPKGVVATFNRIISVLNSMKLVQGVGIYITPTADGWIISTVKPTDDGATASSGSSSGMADNLLAGAQWQTVDVMDAACVRSTIQVLTKPS